MISRELSPPVPNAGRSGEIPMLSIPASIRVSVADHTPFDRRRGAPRAAFPPPTGRRGRPPRHGKPTTSPGPPPHTPPPLVRRALARGGPPGFRPPADPL